jgi:N-acetylglucosamine malate deacetylase 1
MKLDLLAIGVHPDDIEISAAGTICKHVKMGKRVGMLDLTKGEMGSRGNAELRLQEANEAGKILGVLIRDNLGMDDCFFTEDKQHIIAIIEKIRLYQPEIVLCNAVNDRHPDHGRASKLVSDACFYSGLAKIETSHAGKLQSAWRPRAIYHYIQDYYMKPDFVVDVSDFMDQKMQAIAAFSSQFYNPNSDNSGPVTPISTPEFLAILRNRPADYGRNINVKYAEAFTVERTLGVHSLFDLI